MITAKPKVFSPATQINFSAAPHFIYLESRIASCSSLRGEGDLPLFPAWLMLRINYKPRFLRPRRSTLRPLRDAAAEFVFSRRRRQRESSCGYHPPRHLLESNCAAPLSWRARSADDKKFASAIINFAGSEQTARAELLSLY
jgi:hypothetical protein